MTGCGRSGARRRDPRWCDTPPHICHWPRCPPWLLLHAGHDAGHDSGCGMITAPRPACRRDPGQRCEHPDCSWPACGGPPSEWRCTACGAVHHLHPAISRPVGCLAARPDARHDGTALRPCAAPLERIR